MVNDLTPGQLSLAYFSIYQEAIIQAILIKAMMQLDLFYFH